MAPLELEQRPWRRRQRQRQRKDQKEAMGERRIHDLPDDLLRWILLRLDSSLWLIRAACVCKRWRRVVTDGADEGRAFLRLASSLHPPTVVGQYHNNFTSGVHWFVMPSPSHIRGGRFSVDEFHDKYASVADCRGGLVLFRMSSGPCVRSVPDLVVYDPLTRKRWWMSRPCPPNKQDYRYCVGDVFLLDGDDGHISISNFRLLYQLDAAAADPQACIFSTANGGEWDWLWVLPEETCCQTTRNSFNYRLPWPQFLRACP